jgi:hypothetical protein
MLMVTPTVSAVLVRAVYVTSGDESISRSSAFQS